MTFFRHCLGEECSRHGRYGALPLGAHTFDEAEQVPLGVRDLADEPALPLGLHNEPEAA
jgi:hypothetical protein